MAIHVLSYWQMLPFHDLVPLFVKTFLSFWHLFPYVIFYKFNFASYLNIRETNCINDRVIYCIIPEIGTIIQDITQSSNNSRECCSNKDLGILCAHQYLNKQSIFDTFVLNIRPNSVDHHFSIRQHSKFIMCTNWGKNIYKTDCVTHLLHSMSH